MVWFQRKMFAGGWSEKLPPESPGQAKRGLPRFAGTVRDDPGGELRSPGAGAGETANEGAVFAKLPVLETVELIPAELTAEPDAFEKIGEERTFEVEISEPRLVKREFVRPKFRRKAEREAAPLIARRCYGMRLAATLRRGLSRVSSSPNASITSRFSESRRCRRSGARP